MPYSLSALTVATVDYVPQSVATLRSVRRHGVYSSIHLFVIDGTAQTVNRLQKILGSDADWISIFGPSDLSEERAGFLASFDQYNRMELSCLAKYVGISHVLRQESAGDICLLVDSDMFAIADIHTAIDAMGLHAVLLTPHLMRPSSDDVEHDIMNHGWINAGFLAFRRNHRDTGVILNWLISRISRRGYLAPQYGLSCDQKWVSALPILFRAQSFVSNHPGLNVGYWNLNERPVTRSGEAILTSGDPLLLFHFSGFDWSGSRRLSRHASVNVPAGSVLEDLCKRYQAELDGVADLRMAIQGLERLECTSADLTGRMRAGFIRNGVDITGATMRPGLFSRWGEKMDLLVRRTKVWCEGRA